MSNEELKKNIGNRIKQLRIEANLTQEELANKLKSVKGKSSIANYENGSNLPSDEVKFQLCNIFNCSLDYLMCKTDIRNSEEQIKQEFEFAYHKEMEGLSDEEIADALRFYKQIKYGNKKNKSDN